MCVYCVAIKVKNNTLFYESCLLQILLSAIFFLFIREPFCFVHFSPNYSFLKFQLLQIQASSNSGFFKFKLRKILAFSNSGFENFCLQIPASRNSSFFKFRLRKIQASKNSGFGKFWLQKILFLFTVSSLQTPLTFLGES